MQREFTLWVGKIGVGVSRSLKSARRRARRAAQEEATLTGVAEWVVRDEEGKIVARGLESA